MQSQMNASGGPRQVATTVIPSQGAPFQAQAPQIEGRRRVLGIQVEVLPSAYSGERGSFPFYTEEHYAATLKDPLKNTFGKIAKRAMVKISAVAAFLGIPVAQIAANEERDLGLYTYGAQHWENLQKIVSNGWEIASAVSIGVAAALATTLVAIGLAVPFTSNGPREDMIRHYEVEHEDAEVRKTQRAKRRKIETHEMVRKFRGAAFAAAVPLAIFDIASHFSASASEIVKQFNTATEAAVGAFIALALASWATLARRNSAIQKAADVEERYEKAKERAELGARAAEAAANGPAGAVPAAAPVPRTQEEADEFAALLDAIDQQGYEVTHREADLQVAAEKVGLAKAAQAALEDSLRAKVQGPVPVGGTAIVLASGVAMAPPVEAPAPTPETVEMPAPAATEPLRGSPAEGIPPTVTEEQAPRTDATPTGYDSGGPAVSV